MLQRTAVDILELNNTEKKITIVTKLFPLQRRKASSTYTDKGQEGKTGVFQGGQWWKGASIRKG
jgi:hypothetical protein